MTVETKEPAKEMRNKAMERKLAKGEAIAVDNVGLKAGHGVYEIPKSVKLDDVDLCIRETEDWIWSVGREKQTGRILAATDARYYQHPGYDCLWLR